jgi:hypothetical protein
MNALALATLALLPQAEERLGNLALEDVARLFRAAEEAAAGDGGALWGVDLAVPVLVVDPLSRRVAANRADAEGVLVEQGGVFLGTLPKEKPVANAPVEWLGERWAMVLSLFVTDVPAERVALVAHESFHVVQPGLGLYVFGDENAHLDGPDGRLWLQLEWRALGRALVSAGEERSAAVRDALDFRAARRALHAEAAANENALELREGLAAYTGQRLAGLDAAACVADVERRAAKEDGFNRSFAYFSGPLHGYLLDALAPDWRRGLDGKSDLGALLATAAGVTPDAARAEGRAKTYGGEALRAAERQRDAERLARLARFRKLLVEGPVLVLDLSVLRPGSTMNTRKTFPLEEGRIVYTERRHTAEWGTLTIGEGAAILEDARTKRGYVSLENAALDRKSGPGWTLEVAPGWCVAPGERPGDFRVERVP